LAQGVLLPQDSVVEEARPHGQGAFVWARGPGGVGGGMTSRSAGFPQPGKIFCTQAAGERHLA
jgi:hypothetical protein